MTAPLSIWVVSDGRIGMENQALGLAEAVQRLTPATITVKRIRWRGAFDKLPSALKASWMLDPSSDAVVPAPGEGWPDLWIATGRAVVHAARRQSGGVEGRDGRRVGRVETDMGSVAGGGALAVVRPRGPELGEGPAVADADPVLHDPARADRGHHGVIEDAGAVQVRDADRNVRHQRSARFGGLCHRPISTRP